MTRIRVALAGAALGLLLTPANAGAATIKVTTTKDVIGNDSRCSLREAISAANSDHVPGRVRGECRPGHGADQVVLQKGKYTLFIPGARENGNASGDLDVQGRVVVRGAGAAVAAVAAMPA